LWKKPFSSDRKIQFNGQRRKEDRIMKTKEEKSGTSRLAYIALIGLISSVLGFAIVFFYPYSVPAVPYQPVSPLLLGGVVFGIFGTIVLLLLAIWYSYSYLFASRKRIKEGRELSVYDAMSLRAGWPKWLKWWYLYLPLAVPLILVQSGVLAYGAFWIAFFGYIGAAILYQFLAARRWLRRQNKS
jgi:hypothetical protein